MSERELPEPSHEFMDAVCETNSPCIDCGFCGRCHFATGPRSDLPSDEIDSLRNRSRLQPDRYVEDASNDAIGWGMLDGKQAVWRCPCHKIVRFEEWIWRHRKLIVKYLKERAARMKSVAAREVAVADELEADAFI